MPEALGVLGPKGDPARLDEVARLLNDMVRTGIIADYPGWRRIVAPASPGANRIKARRRTSARLNSATHGRYREFMSPGMRRGNHPRAAWAYGRRPVIARSNRQVRNFTLTVSGGEISQLRS